MISRNNKMHPDDTTLIKPVLHVLDLALKHLPLMLPAGFVSSDHPDDHLRPEKLTGETALMLYLVHHCIKDNIEISDRLKKLAAILIPFARNKKLLLDVCLHPVHAMEYAQPHILLSKIGFPDADFDHLLRHSINSITGVGLERMPHRLMEQHWLKNTWDNTADTSDYNLYIPSTQLDYPMDLLHSGREEIYAFTHALMYVTDFGKHSPQLPVSVDNILEQAEALLINRIQAEDYDLAGELLLAWPLLQQPLSPAASFAFKILLRLVDDAGILPSPGLNLQTLNQLEGEQKSKYFFATSYHTAYVMALLCAALAKGNNNEEPYADANLSHAPYLLQLHQHSNNTNWYRIFSSFSENDQNLGSSFLCNLALIKTMHAKDYAAASTIIRFAYQNNLSNAILTSQSIALIERLSFLATNNY